MLGLTVDVGPNLETVLILLIGGVPTVISTLTLRQSRKAAKATAPANGTTHNLSGQLDDVRTIAHGAATAAEAAVMKATGAAEEAARVAREGSGKLHQLAADFDEHRRFEEPLLEDLLRAHNLEPRATYPKAKGGKDAAGASESS